MNIQELIAQQMVKDCYYLPSGKIEVPAMTGNVQGYQDVRINVQNDADFYIEGITGSYGYFNPAEPPTAPESFTFDPLPADGVERVVFRAIDGASNRLLTGDYVGVETFFAGGGVGKPLYMRMPFRHIVQRNSFIRFEFQNATESAFLIDFTLHGWKYF